MPEKRACKKYFLLFTFVGGEIGKTDNSMIKQGITFAWLIFLDPFVQKNKANKMKSFLLIFIRGDSFNNFSKFEFLKQRNPKSE